MSIILNLVKVKIKKIKKYVLFKMESLDLTVLKTSGFIWVVNTHSDTFHMVYIANNWNDVANIIKNNIDMDTDDTFELLQKKSIINFPNKTLEYENDYWYV